MSPAENKAKTSKIERYYNTLLVNWQLVFKIFELILSIVNISIIYQPAHEIGFGLHNLGEIIVIYTTYSTALLSITVILMGYILKERFPLRTYAIFCFVGFFLFSTTGGLLIKESIQVRNPIFHPSAENMHMLVASACLSFFNGIVSAADGALTIYKAEHF